MSVNCPYDDDWCLHKAQEFMAFKQRVRNLAENKENQVLFEPAADTCPQDKNTCDRYRRYLNIVNKIKAGEKQK